MSAAAALVQITHDGAVVPERHRSAHPPTVSILALHARQRTGAGRTTLVSWHSADADGERLDAAIDY